MLTNLDLVLKKNMNLFIKICFALSCSMLTLLATGAMAGEGSEKSAEASIPKQRYGYNSGGDGNWFFGLGLGAQAYFGDHNKQLGFGSRLSLNFDVSGGKWINDNWGVRVGLNGMKAKGLTQNGSYSSYDVVDDSQDLLAQSFNYFSVRADAMLHASNLVFGVDESRVYNMVPYVGLGFASIVDKPKRTGFSPNLGLLQTFRITDRLDLTWDIRGQLLGDGFDGEKGGRSMDGILTSQIGVKISL